MMYNNPHYGNNLLHAMCGSRERSVNDKTVLMLKEYKLITYVLQIYMPCYHKMVKLSDKHILFILYVAYSIVWYFIWWTFFF